MSQRPTLGQVLRPVLADAPASLRLSPHQWKTLRMLAVCRTPALGGQAFYCPHCEREHVVAHTRSVRAFHDRLAEHVKGLWASPFRPVSSTLRYANRRSRRWT